MKEEIDLFLEIDFSDISSLVCNRKESNLTERRLLLYIYTADKVLQS